MKTVLGLDLGTNSIGWALVNEAENESENSEIMKLGVRVNPLTTEEQLDFEKGRPLSINADRTLKRGARRNLQRFKLRRKNLIEILKKYNLITDKTFLTEVGKNTTHQTLHLRAKAAKEKIDLVDFAKVLLTINKKRGYKSSRKTVADEDGISIDGMAVAKYLYDNNITPGQYVYYLLQNDKKYIPDFYQSDLKEEFKKIWITQKQFYPTILTDELFNNLQGKNKSATWKVCEEPFNIEGIKLVGKKDEQRLQKYELRVKALSKQIDLEHLAIVLQEINNDINKSSGYLGAIGDRSKILYLDKITVGQYLYNQIENNKHQSLKGQVFYRQDYLDEFEKIWETQAKFHPQLTRELKEEIRDVIIFYQRKLKSQKHLIAECQFEKHHKAIPKSSPLFQEFKIWQNINNLTFKYIGEDVIDLFNASNNEEFILDLESKKKIFEELNIRGNLNAKEVLRILNKKPKDWKCNFDKIEGNRTNKALYNIYQNIAEAEGYGFDWARKTANEIKSELLAIFKEIGIKSTILNFDASLKGNELDQQDSYQLWHLLYSAEDDNKINEKDKLRYGNTNVSLKKKLENKYGFKPEYAKWLVNISLQQDYGRLSSRAIKKILPYLQKGFTYDKACEKAGYNHSNSFTRDALDSRILKDKLDLLPKNSLRNPVVEKILNQMVNLVNQIIDTYGKPNEVRIELSRELKKSATERKDSSAFIAKRTRQNEDIKKLITKEFGIPNPTKNDVIRYRLYEELKDVGYKTIFTNQYISKDKLFSKEIDIEHIIPKALMFNDSFSNKTLAFRKINQDKGNRTGLDFISSDYESKLDSYLERIEILYNKGKGAINKAKYKNLLMSKNNLPDGFIERDLRNSQYIAKKAKAMLFEVFENVVSTTGSITDKLREDWGLINVMKELNLPKYKALELTEFEERKDNKKVEVIKEWTKRNDHRHHAMDALTVAFTTHNHIQYLNFLSARKDVTHKQHKVINNIEKLIKKEGKFIAPLKNFRAIAKEHIQSILVSFKAKNKVVTKNKNKVKIAGKDKYITKTQLTPRGQLHKETVYGKLQEAVVKEEKINANFNEEKILQVTKPSYKYALLNRLKEFDYNPKLAFTGKNSLLKNPLYINGLKKDKVPEKVKTKAFETTYTIRKEINPDNFKNAKSLDKIVDKKIKKLLVDRLEKYNNNAKEAFSNLEENPIYLDIEKTITIKRVTIYGVKNAEPLHYKKDNLGKNILDNDDKEIPVDYVSTGNNHHVAIYLDEDNNLHDEVVSFYEVVQRANLGHPIIDKDFNNDLGWKFLFTLKQNEMFVFPSEDFNPNDYDLLDEDNYKKISPNLFRVQKFSKLKYGNSAVREYVFRHHLETEIIDKKELKNASYKIFKSTKEFSDIIKVRINHIGQIVQVGEY